MAPLVVMSVALLLIWCIQFGTEWIRIQSDHRHYMAGGFWHEGIAESGPHRGDNRRA